MNRRDLCKGVAAGVGQSVLFSASARAATAKPGTGDSADLTLTAASRAIRSGDLSCVDLTRACLARIDARNPRVNAIITAARESALAQAATLDAEAKAGKFRSALHGVPLALKDNIDTAGIRTTNASALHKDRVPTADARVVARLKDAGAVILAKANMAEFAVSPTSATSNFGPVHNPWNLDYVSGGSSGGSAAALAAHMCLGALGTDSGGSVRLPSAWCGTVGLKPTLGLVSNTGVGPGIPLIDTTGAMARTAEDVALLFTHMTGYDPIDVNSVDRPGVDYVAGLGMSLANLRVGVPRNPYWQRVDPQVAAAAEAALPVLAKLAGSVKDVEFKGGKMPDDPFTLADIYSYHNDFYPKQAALYQPRTRAILAMCEEYFNGPTAGQASHKVTQYIRSTTAIRRRQHTIDAAFDGFDVIVMPTMKSLPPTVKVAVENEYAPGLKHPTLANIENTFPFNMLGLPAISVPCGFSKEGLPIGLMIAGPHFSEATLLALAAAYQNATPWRERRPA